MGNLHIGIDTGGTFTDIVIFDSENKKIKILKLPSTTKNPEKAIIDSIKALDLDSTSIKLINHASTVATNALLTHSGLPRTALITNRGFIDILEIGRQKRAEIYNLKFVRPIPLVPRKYRFGISGRIDSKGKILENINENELYGIKKEIEKEKIESLAISFLNSYVNPIQEMQVKKFFKKFMKYVFASFEIDPQYREYERTSTTVVNAVLSPIISKYLDILSAEMVNLGIYAPLYMMSSNGGLNTIKHASEMPVSLIESGPTAGVIASLFLAKNLKLKNVITFDMGGTTAKVGMIIDGKPDISYEYEAAGKTHSGRSIRGSGYTVRYPFLDLAEVSAGGGTIAWIDEGNSLQVGPQSAGADPGPAAYNKGGKDPTVTDANIILGRLNPEYLLSGNMRIFKDLSIKALKKLSNKLNMNEIEVSNGILKLINNAMAKAISIVSIERGRDPRDFTMISFGGAGPLHACELAEEIGIREILVPEHPGLFSAFGLLTVDITRVYTSSVILNDINGTFQNLIKKANKELKEENFNNVEFEKYLDVRYAGQSFEITIPYKKGLNIKNKFDIEHKRLYGYSSSDPVEIVNAKLIAKAQVPKIKMNRAHMKKQCKVESKMRNVFLNGEFINSPLYVRDDLCPGFTNIGPAIIEGYDSTILVKENWKWEVDEYRNIILRR